MKRLLCALPILLMVVLPARAQHTAVLSWTAPADAGVAYNVYRLTGSCLASGTAGFTKINTIREPGASYNCAKPLFNFYG